MTSISRHFTWRVAVNIALTAAMPSISVWMICVHSHQDLYPRFYFLSMPVAILASLLTIVSIIRLIRLLRYPIAQTEIMTRAIVNNDLMLHIPETDDPILHRASHDMNRILESYRRDQNDIETRKSYYDRILRVMTHELRNTITPIVSLTDLIIQNPDAQTHEEQIEAISIINGQAHNICSFLESYRQLTMLTQPNMTDIPVLRLFMQLKTLLSAEPGADRVRFETTGDMTIHADASLLPLALINIIRNAIQAIEGVPDGEISVLASAPGGIPRITVTNNGPEIPQPQIENIFLPFFSTKKKGSGIGLALSRQIMQLHEGTLTCSSHYPFTTFTLSFKA